MPSETWSFIIVAGGTGSRLGGIPKQFRFLNGQPVWKWSAKIAEKLWVEGTISELVLVVPPEYMLEANEQNDFKIPIQITVGGPTRSQSVMNGLRISSGSHVLVHDAARPFITEELWSELNTRAEKECILVATWPQPGAVDEAILKESNFAFETITQIRNVRNAKGISPKEALGLYCHNTQNNLVSFWPIIKKLSNINAVIATGEKPSGVSFLVGTVEFTIPLAGKLDAAAEREAILKDLEYQRGFLIGVDKKLSNEKFVSGAPAHVLDMERKKKADAETKIKAYEEALNLLK